MSDLDFCMPTLGADMAKGTLLTWYVKPGDAVHRGQVIADVDTEKSAIEVEIWTDGVIDELCVPEGTEVPVGTVLARLRPQESRIPAPAGPAPAPRKSAPVEPASVEPASEAHAAGAQSPVLRRLAKQLHVDLDELHGSGRYGRITRADVERAATPGAPAPAAAATARSGGDHVRASPLARRRAREAGVALADLVGSGPDGAIVAADVSPPAVPSTVPSSVPSTAAPAAVPAPATRPRSRRSAGTAEMRTAIARLMTRAKREIPHYYLSTTIDVSPALAWLRAHNATLPVSERVLPIALLLKATALAAADHPDLNGHYTDEGYQPSSVVRLGLPIALRTGGLVTPTLDNAEQVPLVDLNGRLRDVATRARQGNLRASDFRPPTLTVTNLGDQGVEAVFGVIYPPQVALVGFGAITERPWAENGLLGVRPLVTATLSADHRVSDGHRGGLFLTAIADRLAHPEDL